MDKKMNSLNYILDTIDPDTHKKKFVSDLKEQGYIDRTARNMEAALKNGKIRKKINWIKSRAELKYFIQQLISKGIIDNEVNGIWLLTSNCFLVKGTAITASVLQRDHPPSTKKKTQISTLLNKYLKYSEAKRNIKG